MLSDENLALFPDFQQRLAVLKTLGYVSEDGAEGGEHDGHDGAAAAGAAHAGGGAGEGEEGEEGGADHRWKGRQGDRGTVQLKGRVACEVNTSDELILTEVVFENVLEPLTPAEAAATLSAFIFQAKTGDEPTLTPGLVTARDHILQVRALTCSGVEPFAFRPPSVLSLLSASLVVPRLFPSLSFLPQSPYSCFFFPSSLACRWPVFLLRCRWPTFSFSRSLIILLPFPFLLFLSCPLLLILHSFPCTYAYMVWGVYHRSRPVWPCCSGSTV